MEEEPNIQQAKAKRMTAAKGRRRRTSLINEVPGEREEEVRVKG